MSKWQPIATAPRDGRPFLALNNDMECHVSKIDEYGRILRRSHQQRWSQSFLVEAGRKWLESEEFNFDTHWSIWTRGYEFNPTHWMPLPSPPCDGGR